jgi:group I intron endonuclease
MENESYIIYCHETPSGKRYVGVTKTTINKRWQKGKGYKNNKYFWRAIQKYGWDNIEHYILFEGVNRSFAENKEKELIALWQTTNPNYGYNIEGGGNINKIVSESTRKKMSLYFKEYYKTHTSPSKGKVLSEETRKKISETRMGMKWSEEHRQKELKRRKDNPRHCSEETKEKMKQAYKERAIKHNKPVYQYDLDGNLIACFESIRQASRETGGDRQCISACCNGAAKTAKGFVWSFTIKEMSGV